ncbi:Copper resistance protein CopC [Crenothrix polyspora]|jgi:methionine-rich copper-binding protein CopC|uniref:Copper resistance protein C n=1 Tax=Crenothrix polyspora TaxID=360316 RepID=A0A1R4HED1_9GAMM|nr:copper resistance CopC family protein [Crenothrix polyspora]SJM94567.1 Copper resistance protein CopC [Crenothrix polyspora]
MKSIINNKTKKRTPRLSQIAVMACLALPCSVFAHAILVKSQPAKDATLTEAPKQIDVWFNDKVGSEHKALAVIDSNGTRFDNKDVNQETFDQSHMFATVKPLPPGSYTVRYRVVSIDTHIVTGKFQFSVKAP